MSVGLALLVSADLRTIRQLSLGLRELSISPDACQDAGTAVLLLKRRKFDAVIVDLQLGEKSGQILDEARLSPSNSTAVTFGIGNNDAEVTSAFRKKSQFVFERPLSSQSIHKTLMPAYGLILRERRRYFRYPVSIPVIIRSENMQEVWCNSVNISEGGIALSTQAPFLAGESVRVQYMLPDRTIPFFAESTICWSKTGHLGVRFVSISDEQKFELQTWLSQKLEETLPEFVVEQFRKMEAGLDKTGADQRCDLPFTTPAYGVKNKPLSLNLAGPRSAPISISSFRSKMFPKTLWDKIARYQAWVFPPETEWIRHYLGKKGRK